MAHSVRLFVAGAGGFLGGAAIRAASASGTVAAGLVRTEEQAVRVRNDGGHPVVGDIFRAEAWCHELEGADAVLYLVQSAADSLEERRRVRVEGLGHLLEAMSRANVPRLVVGSGYWVYADDAGWIREESPLAPVSISAINFETEERARREARLSGVDVVVARPGMVYGDGSWFCEMVRSLRDGSYHYISPGDNYLSPVELSDAGRALVTLADRGVPGETYLVVDDRPVRTREFAVSVAEWLGVSAPTSIPLDSAESEWGPDLAQLNRASRRASNAKIRGLGWSPVWPEFRAGLEGAWASMRG